MKENKLSKKQGRINILAILLPGQRKLLAFFLGYNMRQIRAKEKHEENQQTMERLVKVAHNCICEFNGDQWCIEHLQYLQKISGANSARLPYNRQKGLVCRWCVHSDLIPNRDVKNIALIEVIKANLLFQNMYELAQKLIICLVKPSTFLPKFAFLI